MPAMGATGQPEVPARPFRPFSTYRLPRRLRFHRSGWAVCGAALFLGVAAIATGNNLLFLLLGAILGFIALSGWMSEQVLRKLRVIRHPPGGIVAGEPARFSYSVENGKRRLPSFSLELAEQGERGGTFVAVIEPAETADARLEFVFPRRGVYSLEGITLSTSFPFGLFRKERDLPLPGTVTVWPRIDRPVPPRSGRGRFQRSDGAARSDAVGARAEFRSLRDYRPGDDPRDVHWRSSARRSAPVVREYERDNGDSLWIAVDLCAVDDPAGDSVAEVAASLVAGAHRRGDTFGLVTPDEQLPLGSGTAQLERALDLLARSVFRPDAPAIEHPGDKGKIVLVAASPREREGWGAVVTPEDPE
jgi:uncharacterized protein (DUF58 family)